ncbi:peptidase S9 [Jeotgalicoccus coquinae]|uniref:Dipeptidyl aminopeptidase/acylaminoacyl peptidase n=1 Tax=Jeotgalicoccus coquinae TaxID=709509 RepID=A0A6V7RT08_9STAP|nr:prolyl oligopeptidase family serine peptidase [Jeotgalicoccus coquinae]MBB6423334.1 dipeptidyl aminopeptidase/acylaminoacyl peptidase [Jeotgalicoccus coquinae]GGE08877.1 peptidase S9 [Jeotgalicoccus coquinae]CAD2081717.1 Prolyl endopeptidase precursor [Jeotgalicoccus coquinae]
MTEFTKYLSLKLDKSEENLYVISDETGKRELYSYNLKGKSYVKVSDEQENVKNYWFADNGLLIGTDLNGNEREQLTFFKGEEKVQLTADDDYYHHYGVHMNGGFIYLRHHKNGKTFELIEHSEGHDTVLNSFETSSSIIGKFDDSHLLMSQAVNNIDKKVYLYNLETAELKNTELPAGRFGNYQSLNHSEALFTSDYLEGNLNLYKLNKETFEFKKLTYFKWDIQKVIVLEDKNTVIFEVNKKGFSKLFKYDVENDLLETLQFMSEGVVHSLVNSNNKLYALYSDMATPHAVYQFDLTDGSTEKLFGNDEAAIEIQTMHSTYPSFDGLDVPYYLYCQDTDNTPTAIHVHGGPESQARPEFNELYYKLYKEGYQIAVPNIRGSTGYSKFYIGLDNQEKRIDAAKDVVELREHLIKNHQSDKDNMFIMGRSYGGFMTLLLITQFPKLWKGAVDIVGISHFTTLLTNTPAWRREQRSHEYGFIGRHDEFMQCIAPLNNTQRIRCPLRIFHSHNDVRVPYSESVQMYERMKEQNKDVELTAYENEGHQYLYTENQDDMNSRLIAFFNEQISR